MFLSFRVLTSSVSRTAQNQLYVGIQSERACSTSELIAISTLVRPRVVAPKTPDKRMLNFTDFFVLAKYG